MTYFYKFWPIISFVFKIVGQKSKKSARYYRRDLRNIFTFWGGVERGEVKLFLKIRI